MKATASIYTRNPVIPPNVPPLALVPIPDAWATARTPKRKKLSGSSAASKRLALKFRDGRRCFYCHLRLGSRRKAGPATLDHLIPSMLVGNWDLKNLVLACRPCNNAKDNQIPAVLMPLLSVLVYQLAKMNAAPVERSLVPVGGAQ